MRFGVQYRRQNPGLWGRAGAGWNRQLASYARSAREVGTPTRSCWSSSVILTGRYLSFVVFARLSSFKARHGMRLIIKIKSRFVLVWLLCFSPLRLQASSFVYIYPNLFASYRLKHSFSGFSLCVEAAGLASWTMVQYSLNQNYLGFVQWFC